MVDFYSVILHFAFAEFEEERKNYDACKRIYETMLSQAQHRLEELNRVKDQLLEDEEKKGGDDNKESAPLASVDENPRSKDEGNIEEKIQKIINKDRRLSKEDTKDSIEQRIQEAMREETLIYVHYMRFCRRTEGSKAMRNVFTRARKSTGCTYHVFLASALLEFICHKEPNIGLNILRVGAQKFGEDPDYVLHYIDYLIHLNDDSNIRALFEKSLSSIPLEKSKKIWNAFLDFETKYGDLTTIKSIEKRRAEAYPDEILGFTSLAERYRFMDLFPCKMRDLHVFGSKKQQKLVMPTSDASSTLNLLSGIKKEDFPRPDLSQMIAFSRKGGTSGITAGSLNPSLLPFKAILMQTSYGILSKFLQSLPSAQQFQGILFCFVFLNSYYHVRIFFPQILFVICLGPYVPIDDLIGLIRNTSIPAPGTASKATTVPIHRPLKRKRRNIRKQELS